MALILEAKKETLSGPTPPPPPPPIKKNKKKKTKKKRADVFFSIPASPRWTLNSSETQMYGDSHVIM